MTFYSLYEIEQDFRNALLTVDHPFTGEMKFDTGWQKFTCPESKHSKTSARYRAHSDGAPMLKFQCKRCGINKNFPYKNCNAIELTPMQRQAKKIEDSKIRRERAIKEEELRKHSRKEMITAWNNSYPCINHKYFAKKKLNDVRLDDDIRIDSNDNLICPVRSMSGDLISTQTVNDYGKFFRKNISIKNGFHILLPYSTAIEDHDEIFFAEGIATCFTIRSAVQKPVIICYGKRFHEIAPIIAKCYSGKQFTYCGDIPSEREKVTSEDSARQAINLVGGSLCLPDFSMIPDNLNPEISRSDFNDLFCLIFQQGKDREIAFSEIRHQLELSQKNLSHGNNIMKDNAEQIESDNNSNLRWIKQTIKKEDYPEFTLDSYGKKKPLNTYGNLKYMLDRFGITVRWNAMSHLREVIMPESESRLFLDDAENSALREITNKAELHHMPTSKVDDHLTTLAQQNAYHPIVECIKSKPWDRTERLNTFIGTVKTTNDDFSHRLIRRWMISGIAALFSENGFAAQGVLVLQGKQNIGKTRWVKSLDPINCGAVKEGALLDPANKDSVITSAAHWIVELGELDATFRRADIARLKSHVTNQIDIVRFPFARKNSRLPRRTIFAATVNESRYLIDDTGNRRWWTIEVLEIELNHNLDMQQIWAEAYHYWKSGEQHWLTTEELNLLNKTNKEHEQLDPFEEKVLSFFNWSDPNWRSHNTVSMTATSVLEVLGYKLTPNDKKSPTQMGKVLTKLTGEKPIRKSNGRYHTLPRYRYPGDT